MKTIHHYLLILATALTMVACDYSNYPSGPSEYVYDTMDCSGWNIPAEAITVREALRIGKALGAGGTSTETYYVKGIVTGFDNSLDSKTKLPKHETAMDKYGNALFYIQDNLDVSANFYAYQVLSLDKDSFKSLDQLQIGDFVVIKCNITNYNGTIETTGRGAAYLTFSTNDLVYPLEDVALYEETFAKDLNGWTEMSIVDQGSPIWRQNTTTQGKTSAMVDSLNFSCEKWLISPPIDLSQPHSQPVRCTFDTYFYKNAAGKSIDNVKDYMRFKVRKDGGEWTDMEIPVFNNGSMASYKSNEIDISAYAGSNTQIAFAYRSDASFAPIWSIKDIKILEKKRNRK